MKIGIFSLNTGRLHAETLGMLDRVRERYGYEIEQFHPQPPRSTNMSRSHGLNAFYESVDLRKRCCEHPQGRAAESRAVGRAAPGSRASVASNR